MNTFRKTILFLLALLSYTLLSAQLVVTVAGVLETAGNLDGEPFSALFNNPHGIASDAEGNIYVADRFGHFIRKITPDGTVSTIAGTGETGKADGPGLQATFNEPWGLCTGPDGDLFIADTRNNLIRRIDANGNVSTFAGSGNFGTSNGQGQASTFGNPTGLVMDGVGNMYVADHLTHIIRKIDPTGFVTTIAGKPYTPGTADGTGTEARFYRPYGIALDQDGNIIVADEWNHLIRKVTPDGEVTTIAGTGSIGSEDGLATQASFNYPWDVVVDNNGNLFVADGYNNVVRKILPTGTVTTYVGTAGVTGGVDGEGPDATFSGATGLTYLSFSDEIYVADAYNNLIRKIINLNQETVGLQILEPSNGTLCEGDLFSIRAFPEIYENYRFLVDGEEVQQGASPFFSSTEISGGTHTVQVIATSGTNTINSIEVIFNVIPAPVPSVTVLGDLQFFEGDSVVLIASFADQYFWNTGDSTALITVFESGIYSLEVIDENGCLGSSLPIEVTVLQPADPPTITFLQGSEILCPQTSAILQSNYSEGIQWFLDGWPIDGATTSTLEIEEEGIYQLQFTDTLGAITFSEEIGVTQMLPQIIDFSVDKPTAELNNATLKFTAETEGATSFFWNFGDGNSSTEASPIHTYSAVGDYTPMLITEDLNACKDTLQKIEYIEIYEGGGNNSSTNNPGPGTADSLGLFIPTAFTPNGDAINDIFFVRGESIVSLDLAICNQWGELVFQTSDPTEGWLGDFRGKEAQQGTYTYVANVILTSGQKERIAGHITLLR